MRVQIFFRSGHTRVTTTGSAGPKSLTVSGVRSVIAQGRVQASSGGTIFFTSATDVISNPMRGGKRYLQIGNVKLIGDDVVMMKQWGKLKSLFPMAYIGK